MKIKKNKGLDSEKLVKGLEKKHQELVEDLRITFDLFDMDHDGKVTREELLDIMFKMGMDEDHVIVITLLDQADGQGEDHLIDFEEFSDVVTPFMKQMAATVGGRRLSRRLSLITERENTALSATMKYFDQDESGFIEAKHLKSKLEALSGMKISTDDFQQVMLSVDLDSQGKVNYEEFLKLMEMESHVTQSTEVTSLVQEVSEDMMRMVFEEFDEDGNGVIEPEELRIKLSEWTGKDLSLEETKKIIAQVDVNGDGVVDFEEFLQLMAGMESTL